MNNKIIMNSRQLATFETIMKGNLNISNTVVLLFRFWRLQLVTYVHGTCHGPDPIDCR